MLKNNITVAISTYSERINDAVKIANEFLDNGFEVLIIHQKPLKIYDYSNERYCYIPTKTLGVAKSRNIGIKNCKTKYIWFMDDDIRLLNVDKVSTIFSYQFDIITTRVLNEKGNLRKPYPKEGPIIKTRDFIGVGTIEIIANNDFLIEHDIFFPENVGAGTELPVGDEAIFMYRAQSVGAILRHFDLSLVEHPDESSGKSLSKNTLVAKGNMIRYLYGIKGIAVIVYLSIRLKSTGLSLKDKFILLLKGFLLNKVS
ncbi:hypothetical protein BCS98_15305 [Vibrio breoganii]|uniref:glycosyltransferase family A protein n=1 Tax=Vibrio breoganii TaxID=553239 RepID=UPI000C81F69E|nr:glycosyltransferase family A protein [Vibrio breoganii]PMO90159.1 hypothetical protein BCS98_15305 [Vibrio breoganii]